MINEEVSDAVINASFTELNQLTKNTFSQYYQRFTFYQTQLEKIKNIDYMDFSKADKRFTIMEQMKNQNDIAQKLLGYPSSKGNKANIRPKKDLEEAQNEIEEQKAYINNQLKEQIKNNLFEIKTRNDLKMIMLNISRDIFKLKQDITGITEKFVFTYTDEQKKEMKAISVNVDDFFRVMLSNIDNLSAFGLDKDSRTMATKIKFNKGSLLSQLKKMYGNGRASEIALKEFRNNSGERISALDLYKTLSETPGKFIISKNRLTAKDFEGDEKPILREDGNYIVIRRYQTGFIAQGIVEASINNTDFEYIQDTIDLFAGEDFSSNDEKIGYSMKNLLGSNPSFFSIDTLISSVDKIVSILGESSNIDIMRDKLKEAIFSSQFDPDSYFEDTLGSLPIYNKQ